MAKYERTFKGSLFDFLNELRSSMLDGSISATLEDSSDIELDGVKCAVRVFERYSWSGGNRVSLNVTVVEQNGTLHLSAITSGGSQAMFFKMNTIGEESFLDKLTEAVEKYIDRMLT